MRNKKIDNRISIFLLIIGASIIIFPIYLTFITALKTPEESVRNFFALPNSLYFGNFQTIITDNNFFTYVLNSSVITLVSVVFIIILAPMTAYAIARNLDKKYYKVLFALFSLGIFIPFQVIMLPVVKLMTSLKLLNQFGLILLYITFALTQGIFLYVGYIKTSIPREIEEAAYIDGCSKFRTYKDIIFPLLKPMTSTVVIINALWIWNDFLLPLLILNKSSSYWTIPLFQYNFKTQYTFDYNLAFASFVLAIIPILIVYILFQKNIIQGLTSGAVKN